MTPCGAIPSKILTVLWYLYDNNINALALRLDRCSINISTQSMMTATLVLNEAQKHILTWFSVKIHDLATKSGSVNIDPLLLSTLGISMTQ